MSRLLADSAAPEGVPPGDALPAGLPEVVSGEVLFGDAGADGSADDSAGAVTPTMRWAALNAEVRRLVGRT